jgi:hypothetical protein
MGYSDFSESSLTADERVAEAHRILGMLESDTDAMTPREREFVESMDGCRFCSIKQLFYLRDIKDKYL